MKPTSRLKLRGIFRCGTAVVELAIVLPVLLILLIGAIEIGRGISVSRTCASAARAGARVYSMRKSKSETDVRNMVAQIMAEANFKNYTVTLDPAPSANIKQLDPLKVTVSVNVADSTWHQTPWFLKASSKISSSCAMPADLGESAEDKTPTPPVVETPTLLDNDPEGENSGVTAADLKDLEKDAKKAVKKAVKAREDAVEEAEDAAEAVAKATASGKAKDWEDATKKLDKAAKADAEAVAAEALARQYLQALTTATTGRTSP